MMITNCKVVNNNKSRWFPEIILDEVNWKLIDSYINIYYAIPEIDYKKAWERTEEHAIENTIIAEIRSNNSKDDNYLLNNIISNNDKIEEMDQRHGSETEYLSELCDSAIRYYRYKNLKLEKPVLYRIALSHAMHRQWVSTADLIIY